MAGTITSLGIGSGIDANSIVSKLMAVERVPIQQLDARLASYNTKISAFGTISSKFDALETAANALSDPAKLAAYTATLSNEDAVSVTPGTFASAGSYSVEVTQVAKAQKSFSSLYAGGTTFAAGTLQFTIGGSTVDVAFSGGTLDDLRKAINDAGIDVTATTVTGDAGSRLVLTAKETGTDNAFSLAVVGGDANLQSLATFDGAHASAVTAQNAIIKVEGETVTSQSNTITSAIPNVTITAKAVGTSTVDIARNSETAVDKVKAFITAFNDAVNELRTASAYDSSSKTGGPLNGDATVRTLQGLLRQTATSTPSGVAGSAFQSLSALGISFQTNGTLALDETKFNAAVDSDFASVTQTLNAFGDAFESVGQEVTKSGGLIANRTDGLGATVTRLEDKREDMEYRLGLTEQRLRGQFTALDALMGQLSTTSSYLTQQLASLNGSNS